MDVTEVVHLCNKPESFLIEIVNFAVVLLQGIVVWVDEVL